MLNNKADTIEDYILQQLEKKANKQIELNRTALAGEICCAPSQISYVLSTRFTTKRGFAVESRRGLGGYIRITIIKDDSNAFFIGRLIKKINSNTSIARIKLLLRFLMQKRLITARESEIMIRTIIEFYKAEQYGLISSHLRVELTRKVFTSLEKIL